MPQYVMPKSRYRFTTKHFEATTVPLDPESFNSNISPHSMSHFPNKHFSSNDVKMM